MNVLFHKKFKKTYNKLSGNLKQKTDERLVVFRQDQFDQILNNHPLSGKYNGCRSINISGDLRAIYKLIGENLAYFIEIGNHNKLY